MRSKSRSTASADGVVVGGCDKNMPGAAMAMARINARHFRYAVRSPGLKGEKLTISARSGCRAFSAGRWPRRISRASRKRLPDGRARRSVHGEHDVVVARARRNEPPGSSQMASPDQKGRFGRCVRALVNAARSTEAARHHPRDAIENAIALVMATGGSTNRCCTRSAPPP